MGLVEKDYIERMIRDIARFVARMMGLAGKGDYDAALREVRDACQNVFGTSYDLLDALAPGSAADVLRDARAVREYGKLMAHEADVLKLAGKESRSDSQRLRALELLIEAELRGAPAEPAAAAQIKTLAATVDSSRAATRYRQWLDAHPN